MQSLPFSLQRIWLGGSVWSQITITMFSVRQFGLFFFFFSLPRLTIFLLDFGQSCRTREMEHGPNEVGHL